MTAGSGGSSERTSPATTYDIGGDLRVRRPGFGAMRLSGPGVWGCPENRNRAQEVLIETVRLGVDFIDTADAYGPNSNEDLIHETLSPYPSGLVIGTKGGFVRGRDRGWKPSGRPDHLKESCDGSLRRLGLDVIDLYQLHTPDPEVPFEESVGALSELREAGKVRHIGLLNVDTAQLRVALETAPVVSVQNRFNLYDRDSENVLRECIEREIAFLPYFPVAAGKLAGEHDLLDEIGRTHGATPAQVSIAWLLHLAPGVIPIPGTSDPAHLRENVAASEIRLTEDEAAALDDFS